ncbi:MAG: aldo/keto reductase [Steroidobacteraceae bacterium]
MQFKQFGRTDLAVSELGLGCQSLGGGLYYRDDQESIRTLHRAMDLGVTFFDVSDHHSLGRSEELLGRALAGHRNSVVLTTKAGFHYTPMGTFALRVRGAVRPLSQALRTMKRRLHRFRASTGRYDFSPAYLSSAVERSLGRLRTDRIDLFQLYKPNAEQLRRGEFYEVLEKLKAQGKIRHYGIACARSEDAIIALNHAGNASVQVAINFLEQEAIRTVLPRAEERGIAVIARHPRAIGLLTDSHDDIMGDASAYEDQYGERVRQAHELAFLKRPGRSLAQAAIAFVRELPGVCVTLPRASTVAELEENLGSLKVGPFSEAELDRIKSVTA